MISYGIVSTASIVPRFVAGIRASKEGDVAAIASRELAKAQKVATKLQIKKAYGSYEELFSDEEIDIIYIATYNKGHYETAKQALEAGKPVLLEKPFTLSAAEASELFELAAKKGLFLMEAQKAVFLPITLAVKKAIEAGKIGEVKLMRSLTSYPNIDHVKWFPSLESGGGTLHGSGSYPLHYMHYITGENYQAVNGNAIMPKGRSDKQSDLSLKFGTAILANIFITTEFGTDNGMTIYGSQGRIEIPNFWKTQVATIFTKEGREDLQIPFTSEFAYEVDHVNECLKKGLLTSPIMTPELTIETVTLVENQYRKWLQAQ
ncbi:MULTISPECIES: Gfo/Idh/MocA family protein [Enterococcus]|uniref:Gfo/Idh/MocA family protein n=1 Tax=Enterococcus TaxID=1350 RepID=UPI0026F349D6|nr:MULTISPECIES: Gfo/Idh/MocA family oxidoreductase [Enterococcus]MDT2738952.1 Gfo/Idh/MocA family oxidoreductase [Enterococcus canintestini]